MGMDLAQGRSNRELTLMQARERYAFYGPEEWGDTELLALIIGTGAGGRRAVDIARDLLDLFGNLAGIARAPIAALCGVPGVGLARAVRVHAGIQAGLRAGRPLPAPGDPVASPEAASQLLGPGLGLLPHEELHGLYLDRALHPLMVRRLSRGGIAGTQAEPAMVFAPALKAGAAAVIIAHNHPSGDPTPSEEDRSLTRRLLEAGKLLGVPLVDHLVVAGDRYRSVNELQATGRFVLGPVPRRLSPRG